MNFQEEMLAVHNKWRAEVGVSPVTWDTQLAQDAQAWANHLLSQNELVPEPGIDEGQNVMSTPPSFTATEVVDIWGEEKLFYDYDMNDCDAGKVCKHYTQIVWQNTTKIGCAVAKNSSKAYWVCRYAPAGNIIGEKPY